MQDLNAILNDAAVREQKRTHALRGSLFRAVFRHGMGMWADGLRNARAG